jgi:hypothetical protein
VRFDEASLGRDEAKTNPQGERHEKNPTATPTEKYRLITPMPL